MNKKKYRYLMTLLFGSVGIFKRNLYFEFEDVQFKLVKGNKDYEELLCAILEVDDTSGVEFDKEVNRVANITVRFLSSLSWQYKIPIHCGYAGGRGWKKGLSLLKVKRCDYIPRHFHHTIINNIPAVPKIENIKQGLALALYREANVSNSQYYKFLCYWKVLDIDYVKGHNINNWIDNTISNNKWILNRAHFDESILGNKKISTYLREKCRNAISHIRRKPIINPDNIEDLRRITISNNILRELVERFFMPKELKIGSKNLYLTKIKGKRIPIFIVSPHS